MKTELNKEEEQQLISWNNFKELTKKELEDVLEKETFIIIDKNIYKISRAKLS